MVMPPSLSQGWEDAPAISALPMEKSFLLALGRTQSIGGLSLPDPSPASITPALTPLAMASPSQQKAVHPRPAPYVKAQIAFAEARIVQAEGTPNDVEEILAASNGIEEVIPLMRVILSYED